MYSPLFVLSELVCNGFCCVMTRVLVLRVYDSEFEPRTDQIEVCKIDTYCISAKY